jgi:uncharacterized membrane protein YqaE (UPF0057 family)
MRYLLAILLPPVAVLSVGKPGTAILNFFLTLLLWVPGIIHAMFVVSSAEAEKRNDRVVQAIRSQQRPAA